MVEAWAEAVDRYAEKTALFPDERRIIDAMQPGRTLDVGCGTGRVTRFLKDAGHAVEGVDICPEMVERARILHPDIPFTVGDAARLPPLGRFDNVVFSFNTLDYVYPESRRDEAVSGVAGLLEQGGVLAYSTHNWLWLLKPSRRALRRIRHYRGPYYTEDTVYGSLLTYYSNPLGEAAWLRGFGFREVEKYGGALDAWNYYTAVKVSGG